MWQDASPCAVSKTIIRLSNYWSKRLNAPNDVSPPAAQARSRWKDMALFLVSPFISLAYALLMPVAGMVALKEMRKAAARRAEPRQ